MLVERFFLLHSCKTQCCNENSSINALGESTFVPSSCFAFLRFHSLPNGILCTRKKIPYSGKLFEGENFREFRGFVAVRTSFLREILGVASFGVAKTSNPRKFYPQKSYFHQFMKVFSLEIFPLYGNSGVQFVIKFTRLHKVQNKCQPNRCT